MLMGRTKGEKIANSDFCIIRKSRREKSQSIQLAGLRKNTLYGLFIRIIYTGVFINLFYANVSTKPLLSLVTTCLLLISPSNCSA